MPSVPGVPSVPNVPELLALELLELELLELELLELELLFSLHSFVLFTDSCICISSPPSPLFCLGIPAAGAGQGVREG